MPAQNITTGITPAPVWGSGQVNSALQGFQNAANKPAPTGQVFGVPQSPTQQAGLQEAYQASARPAIQQAATNFDRTMAAGNAAQLFSGQRAQANAGIGWGQLGNQSQQLGSQNLLGQTGLGVNQALQSNKIDMSLLQALLGGFGNLTTG